MIVALSFVGGLTLLIGGAELLVRGASRLAMTIGMSPLVVGLTVVAFATSSPELTVSVGSALNGQADLALGNVVGSTIANVLLILGLGAVVAPLVVRSQLVRFDVPVMIAAAALVVVLGLDGAIGTGDGLLLVIGIGLYLARLLHRVRREPAMAPSEADEPAAPPASSPLRDLVSIAVGLALLVAGSRLLVDAAVAVAQRLGVSELVIGLTLVAVGTSLPEIATSLLAVLRGERDLAVGNAVGSNIFNLFAVLGITAVVAPSGVPVARGALDFDLPVMLAVTVACLPIFFTGRLIARWEGVVFLWYYGAYFAYLLLRAAEHDALEPFSAVMLGFVLPLTVLTIGGSVIVAVRRDD
jgi:cation:H+ antiporter